METKFNFNSQVATTREQSERLLALGLKKETADMCSVIDHVSNGGKWEEVDTIFSFTPDDWNFRESVMPRWSLSRLLCMLTGAVPLSEELPTFDNYAFLRLHTVAVSYEYDDYDGDERILVCFNGNGLFAAVVDAIEWLIKEGYFNKEYLENEMEEKA